MPQMCDNRNETEPRANGIRSLTHLLDYTERGLAMQATLCAIDGCTKPVKCRGWCTGHYSRWLRTGEVGSADFWDRQRTTPCAVDDCLTLARAYGFCEHHRIRHKTGDLRTDAQVALDKPPLTYSGMHQRLRRELGLASEQTCVDCQGSAAEWAYDNLDPDEVVAGEQRYSRNTAYYMPMCVRCHRWYDQCHFRGAAVVGAKLTGALVAEIRERYAAGNWTQRALGAEYGLTHATIGRIVRGHSMSHRCGTDPPSGALEVPTQLPSARWTFLPPNSPPPF